MANDTGRMLMATRTPEPAVRRIAHERGVTAETRHGGTVDTFIGDGIKVLWGVPSDLDECGASKSRSSCAGGRRGWWSTNC